MSVDRALKALRSQRFRLDAAAAGRSPGRRVRTRLAAEPQAASARRPGVPRPVGRRDRGAAGSAAGVPARRAGGESQAAPGAARAARGAPGATSSIVTVKCWPTRSKRESIIADPSLVVDPDDDGGQGLRRARRLHGQRSGRSSRSKLSRATRYEVIRRSQAVSPEQVDRVAALKLPGIVTPSDSRRYYPRYELGAHVLGFVDRDSTRAGWCRVRLRQAGARRGRSRLRAGRRQAAAAGIAHRAVARSGRDARADARSPAAVHRGA